MKKNRKNIQSVIFIGTIIKILGLLYKIVITRLLGIEGMRLFSIITPTLTLALVLSSLSIQTVVNQNVASNIACKETKVSTIMKSSFRLTIISSSVISILLLLSFPIYNKIYNNSFIYYPLLTFIPLIFVSNSTGILRGYLEANEQFNYTFLANMFEQISKIILTFALLFIFKNKSIETQVFICFSALMLSELSSLFYLSFKIYKKKRVKYRNIKTRGYEKNILKQALPLTLEQLVLSITAYFEPIIFYYALNKISISIYDATIYYTKVTSYAIPLLMFALFSVQSVAKLTFPKITINRNNPKNLKAILNKTFFISFIIASFNLILCKFYSTEFLYFLYKDSSSNEIVSFLAPLYFFTYFNPIFVIILQSYNKERKLLYVSIFSSILAIVLIYILSSNPIFNTSGYIIGIAISSFIRFILLAYISIKQANYRPNIIKVILMLITLIIYFVINFKYTNIILFFISSLSFVLLTLFLYYLFLKNNKLYLSLKKHTKHL